MYRATPVGGRGLARGCWAYPLWVLVSRHGVFLVDVEGVSGGWYEAAIGCTPSVLYVCVPHTYTVRNGLLIMAHCVHMTLRERHSATLLILGEGFVKPRFRSF